MAAWNTMSPTCVVDGVATITCLEPLFANVVKAVVALAGVGLFIMLIMGGYNFLFAGGDQKKLEMARNTLTMAATGLVIMVSAYLLLKAIGVFTGITNLTNFQVITN